jgi:hypothetical protein
MIDADTATQETLKFSQALQWLFEHATSLEYSAKTSGVGKLSIIVGWRNGFVKTHMQVLAPGGVVDMAEVINTVSLLKRVFDDGSAKG